ncbi:Protein transport protein Sec61 subunit alpha [Cyanidiococcus yangmingshanensis]|uniref:Protein transport protein Sec61 subunit alpha n=1 Tax=Cyanidiococcus yangmingshanensis TaxID=2690220 RepID=A0A7J7IH30_9RHOD|nr:Protein transport protein Sec61 subunit alpha [Cyanidiococcus yangmingshanensis]
MVRTLDLVRPFLPYLPEVKTPPRRVPIKERLIWSLVALAVYLIACQIPLYGFLNTGGSDPFYLMRLVLGASSRGTIMELGFSPIVTSGMIVQLLAGARIIEVDYSNKLDRTLFEAAQKLIGIGFALFEAIIYVYSGMYGPVSSLGHARAALLVGQLFCASVVVMLLDELLQKGYGLGSGISLFIATNIAETIVWSAFSPMTINIGRGVEFEGAVISFFHLLLTRSDKTRALYEAFYRPELPNLSNLLATVTVFLIVIYLQGLRIDLPIKSVKVRGHVSSYPIQLFYTSNTPIILQSTLVSNLYFFSQILWKRFPNTFFVRAFGKWAQYRDTGQFLPVGGLAYYISKPHNLAEIIADPIRALSYILFMLVSCAVMSYLYIEVSGKSARDVAKQLRDQELTIKGHRDTSLVKELNRYIPIAAAFGGVLVGLLTVVADLTGAIGSGTGILLAVTIIYEYSTAFAKESQESGSPLAFFE